MNPDGFLAAQWPAPPTIVAGTTLRRTALKGDPFSAFNLGAYVGDRADAVAENRASLSRSLRLPSEPSWLRQVHGTTVLRAVADDGEPVADKSEAHESEADASVSDDSDSVCAVLTADCLPVLFCRTDGKAWGAAHAGWRGLVAGVLENTLAELKADPADLLVWLGPAISQPAFEVGDEVRATFIAADGEAEGCFAANDRGRWQADLYALARQRLRRAGVTQIFGGDRCTYRESDLFYSYRRDGQCGRMASLVFHRES